MRHLLLLSLLLPPLAAFAQAPATPPGTTAAPQQKTAPAVAAGGAAESGAQAPLTDAQKAKLAELDASLLQAAIDVAQLIDGERAGEVWDGASVVAKRAIDRAGFISHTTSERAKLGALQSRGQGNVARVLYREGAAVPAGLYASVTFPTRFANSPQPVRELVSFRLDDDRTWRVSGYNLRIDAGN